MVSNHIDRAILRKMPAKPVGAWFFSRERLRRLTAAGFVAPVGDRFAITEAGRREALAPDPPVRRRRLPH